MVVLDFVMYLLIIVLFCFVLFCFVLFCFVCFVLVFFFSLLFFVFLFFLEIHDLRLSVITPLVKETMNNADELVSKDDPLTNTQVFYK